MLVAGIHLKLNGLRVAISTVYELYGEHGSATSLYGLAGL
jgi:hypothetical protein